MFRSLVLAATFAGGASAADRAAGDLAVRARHILTTYCGKCHGEKDAAGRLNVFNHTATTAHAHPAPFAAKERSLIVEFVQDGAMPPGRHPRPTAAEVEVLVKWLAADAPAYPPKFDDASAAAAVLADLRAVPAQDVQHMRYVSFAHLLAKAKPETLDAALTSLAAAETKLRTAIKSDGKTFVPVDGTATTFRLDLRGPGWHHADLFKDAEKLAGKYPMIPFDLLWLENPHVLDLDAAAVAATGKLNPHHPTPNPFRPQLFLRGDWLAGQLLDGDTPTPLAEELKALAELGPVKDVDAKRKALSGPTPRPFTQEKTAPPAPASSWYVRDAPPQAGELTLTVEVTGKDGKPPPAKIPANRDVTITAKASLAASVEMVEVPIPPNSAMTWLVMRVLLDGEGGLAADKPRALSPNAEGTIALDAPGTVHYLVYVGERAGVKPVIVRSVHENAKYPIHRVFPPDPAANVIRRVVPLTVVGK